MNRSVLKPFSTSKNKMLECIRKHFHTQFFRRRSKDDYYKSLLTIPGNINRLYIIDLTKTILTIYKYRLIDKVSKVVKMNKEKYQLIKNYIHHIPLSYYEKCEALKDRKWGYPGISKCSSTRLCFYWLSWIRYWVCQEISWISIQ